MEAKKGSETLYCFDYSKKRSTSVRELVAGLTSDSVTPAETNCEYYRFNRSEIRDRCVDLHPKWIIQSEAKSIAKIISDSMVATHSILSELGRLVWRARIHGLPSGELSELEAMGRELSAGFAKHTTISLKDGRRPLQGEVVEIEINDCNVSNISFPSKELSPLTLGTLLFSTPEELQKTEVTLSAVRKQLDEYCRDAASLSGLLSERDVRVEVEIQNEAATTVSPPELELIVEKFGNTLRLA